MNCVIFETDLGFIQIYADTVEQARRDFERIYPGVTADVIGFLPVDLLMEV